jgi:hypothetical protein
MDLEAFGTQLREHVRNGTGLTIGVGIGATKRWRSRRSGHQKSGRNSAACWR